MLAGLMQTLGADPVTSALAGSAMSTAMALDTVAFARRNQRGERAMRAAIDDLGALERLVDLAMQDDAHLELVERVLEAAARTTMVAKIRALGLVLSAGLQADTVDEAAVLVAALTDIEAPHVQVLAVLKAEMRSPSPKTAPYTGTVGLAAPEISVQLPGHGLILTAVLRQLDLHGLLRDVAEGTHNAMSEGPRYVVSNLGFHCLELLSDTPDRTNG
jgi:hypothetical protein